MGHASTKQHTAQLGARFPLQDGESLARRAPHLASQAVDLLLVHMLELGHLRLRCRLLARRLVLPVAQPLAKVRQLTAATERQGHR